MIDIIFAVVFIGLIVAAACFGYYFGTIDGRREGYLEGRLDADKFKDTNMVWRFEENYKKIYRKGYDSEASKQN